MILSVRSVITEKKILYRQNSECFDYNNKTVKTGKNTREFQKKEDKKKYMEVLFMKYVCDVCGWVYDEEEAGVKWEDLPEDFACELCGVGKEDFSPAE